MIHYGIFETMIKKILNQHNKKSNKEEKFEEIIKEMMTASKSNCLEKAFSEFIDIFLSSFRLDKERKAKKVLLIDEIDVLFDKRYFGDTFNQSVELRNEDVVEVFKFIWRNKG